MKKSLLALAVLGAFAGAAAAQHLDRGALDPAARTILATLSSELPVARDFGNEVLMHTPEAIDMSRAVNGLPLLFSHKRDQIVGRVEGIHLDKNKLRGLLRLLAPNRIQRRIQMPLDPP